MNRRALMLGLTGLVVDAHASPRDAARSSVTEASGAAPAITLPDDFGAHPGSRTEWWYITGSLQAGDAMWGFQVTFFRVATGMSSADNPSRFAASELVFAHAALTDLAQHRLRHDQRIARSGFGIAAASIGETGLVLRDWQLRRTGDPEAGRYHANVTSDSAGFALALDLAATQPVLLQGAEGLSQKGPEATQTSRYYSEPQLALHGVLTLDGKPITVTGRAWLDHEWSDAFLPPGAVGWDWIGMNLDDGSALTAFRLRRADGSALWAGGSLRPPRAEPQNFAAEAVRFTPGRIWTSPASRARYPVSWRIATPGGEFSVEALLDNQELDSRASTGAIYWEGLSELRDGQGRAIGRGYLEMTGYASALRL